MGAAFWVRRFVVIFAVAFTVIVGAQALKGHMLGYSLAQGLTLATVSATVFIVTRLYHARRGRHCALCNDMPPPSKTSDR